MNQEQVKELAARLKALQVEAEALAGASTLFPAVWRNALRIQASARMIELNLELEPSVITVDQ